jgi:transketolase
MATRGGCFLGASLSCADLLVYLYSNILRISPDTVQDPDRDYLLLSKGHDVPALYGTLAELGFFPQGRLRRHLSPDDSLYWHPTRRIPGVEFHSGSLGHLLSVGIGIAYDIGLKGGHNRVFVLLGDGELDEGSIWEGLLVAAAFRLTNLVLIVDRNEFQANVATESLIPLEPLEAKFAAFGCRPVLVDGHDFNALRAAFRYLDQPRRGPLAVIARTVRGKGLPSIEARGDRWFCNFNEAEITGLLEELHGAAETPLVSDALVVR